MIDKTTIQVVRENETLNDSDIERHWHHVAESYSHYPTVKHRRRFIINALKKYINKKDFSVFDYGIGEGSLLKEIKDKFQLHEVTVGGCDISEIAINLTKKKISTPYLFCEPFPKIDKKFDLIICSEVIEHTENYLKILEWIFSKLNGEGVLILTTQSGRLYNSDKYTKHVQHFKIEELNPVLANIGFDIRYSCQWGFPFFQLQKFLTNFNFKSIKENYLEGELTLKRKLVFNLAYYLYFIHDFINLGPQIYIVASKKI